jgi:predicted membrane-bound dolichyl-phosphate-mannose-protein mannosyltransferase
LIALALLIGVTVSLAATDDMGFTRDESFYFRAAKDYSGWFDELARNIRDGRPSASFTQQNVDQYWGYNPEHPVLMKALFGVSYLVLHQKTDLLSPSLAMRLPAMLMGALVIALLYLMAMEMTGKRLASLSAAMAMAWMPHFFFHSHLTCFDVPITTAWFAVVYAYWKSLDSTPWAVATGIIWGIALTCKLNAFFIPVVLLGHWGLGGLRQFSVRGARLSVPPVPAALFWMALLGPLVLYVGWPRHWFDTFNRLSWYINFHLTHEHYYVLYFGQNLFKPPFPFAYPFVMTAVTTPIVVLWLWLAGGLSIAWRWIRNRMTGDRFATGILLALNIVIPFLIIARPSTPIFGGVKHWFTALPFLCLLIAPCVAWAQEALQRVNGSNMAGRAFASTILVAATASGVVASWQSHPFGISYYNEVIGGITGGADARAMRQFWGYESRHALDYLRNAAPENASIHWHETTGYAVDMYREEGWLREDLRNAWSIDHASFIVYEHDKGFLDFLTQIWTRYGTHAPVFIVTLHGVPLLSVYANPERVDLATLPRGGWNDGELWLVPAPRGTETGDDGQNESDDDPSLRPALMIDLDMGDAIREAEARMGTALTIMPDLELVIDGADEAAELGSGAPANPPEAE